MTRWEQLAVALLLLAVGIALPLVSEKDIALVLSAMMCALGAAILLRRPS